MPAPRIAIAPADISATFRRDRVAEAIVAGGGELTTDVANADAVVWLDNFDPDGLEKLVASTSARWIQLPWAGVENFADRDLLDDKHVWTCAKGAYAPVVAEHALALLLALFKRVHEFAREETWQGSHVRAIQENSTISGAEEEDLYSLLYSHVVIVGGGGIAQCLVDYLRPYKTKITVVRKHPQPMDGVHEVCGTSELKRVLPEADAVVMALSLTPESEGIIGAEELSLLKPTAFVVNVARGKHIDTDALVKALESKAIAGAALDVTEPEPLPNGHPLWRLPNALVTPHTADSLLWVTQMLSKRVEENVRRFAAHEDLVGVVDPTLGY